LWQAPHTTGQTTSHHARHPYPPYHALRRVRFGSVLQKSFHKRPHLVRTIFLGGPLKFGRGTAHSHLNNKQHGTRAKSTRTVGDGSARPTLPPTRQQWPRLPTSQLSMLHRPDDGSVADEAHPRSCRAVDSRRPTAKHPTPFLRRRHPPNECMHIIASVSVPLELELPSDLRLQAHSTNYCGPRTSGIPHEQAAPALD
jgi:hypothetical protein